MKLFTFLFILFVSVFSYGEILDSCYVSTSVTEDGPRIGQKIEIRADRVGFYALLGNTEDLTTQTLERQVEYFELPVKTPLTDLDRGQANLAEKYILEAKKLMNDPTLGDSMGTGFDLELVRFAKLYVLGDVDGVAPSAVITAFDEHQQELGKFLINILVLPCL